MTIDEPVADILARLRDLTAEEILADAAAAWDERGVWDFVRAHDVPYNPLHDQGFESIDCAPCARRT